jgi:hypothetical protein
MTKNAAQDARDYSAFNNAGQDDGGFRREAQRDQANLI